MSFGFRTSQRKNSILQSFAIDGLNVEAATGFGSRWTSIRRHLKPLLFDSQSLRPLIVSRCGFVRSLEKKVFLKQQQPQRLLIFCIHASKVLFFISFHFDPVYSIRFFFPGFTIHPKVFWNSLV
jgi:hypothetical protein